MYPGYIKCFNGQLQTEYQLDQMLNLQKLWRAQGKKFVTCVTSNINHNNEYTHIKHIDGKLTQHLSEASKMDDVMTIVFSDHGSKWSTYKSFQRPESLIDQWHPFLFIVLPKNEQNYFSKSELRNLEANQFRLTTVKDLHYLLSKFSQQGQDELNGKCKSNWYVKV